MSKEYNIFISWSGQQSKWVAEAMRDWLPLILQAAKPWMSATDIEKGSRGLSEVGSRLLGMKVGLICLTPENLNAPWILYEAGALSKTIDDKTRLCTYLLGGLQFQDVRPPLGMFQATKAEQDDTRRLIHTINKAVSDDPVPESNLDRLFEKMWPDLERKLTTIPEPDQVVDTKRSTEEMVAEILQIAREGANSTKSVQPQILNRAFFGEPILSFSEPPGINQLAVRPVYGYPSAFLGEALTVEPPIVPPQPDRLKKPEGEADASRSRTKPEKGPAK